MRREDQKNLFHKEFLNTNPFQESIKKVQQAGSLMNLDSWGILSNYSFLISMI